MKPPRRLRWWIPAVMILLPAGCAVWLHHREHVARDLGTLALAILSLLLLVLWGIFGTGLRARTRWTAFAVLVLLVGGVVLGLANLTRWEGSVRGSAIPRLVLKSAAPLDTGLGAPAQEPDSRGGTDGAEPEGLLRDSPQFLGPRRDGTVPGVALNRDWEKHPPVELWRRRIGLGWSSFAVRGRRAVTQEQREEAEMVTCYDVLTGALLWSHQNVARFSETMGGDGPRGTPTIEGDRVYAQGATGILDCLRLEDGGVVWSRDVLGDTGAANVIYGKSCSPLIVEDLICVTGGEKGGPTVLAFDKRDGTPRWASGEDAAGYASPVFAVLCGNPQIICHNANTVTGHAVATGEELWRYAWPSNAPRSSQPVVLQDGRVLLTSSYGMGSKLLEISASGGGDAADGVLEVREVWSHPTVMKTKFSNVCVREGYAYGLDEGRLACIEIATGEKKWKGGKFGYGQNLLAGDLLVVQAEWGDVVLVEANPEEFVELGRIPALSSMTWNQPVLAGSYLLVRNDREAVCFRLEVAGEE